MIALSLPPKKTSGDSPTGGGFNLLAANFEANDVGQRWKSRFQWQGRLWWKSLGKEMWMFPYNAGFPQQPWVFPTKKWSLKGVGCMMETFGFQEVRVFKGGDVERVAKVMYKLLEFLKATSFDFEMLELCDDFFLECLENFEDRDSDQSWILEGPFWFPCKPLVTQRSGAMWGGKGGGFGKGYGDSTLAMKTSQRIRPMVAVLLFRFTLKMNMSPKKGPFQKEISSSKPQPVVFRGRVSFREVHFKKTKCFRYNSAELVALIFSTQSSSLKAAP